MAIVTHRILVVKTSSLGDIMHGLQLAQTLKENDPGIEITWVARSRYVPLVRACTAVDHTITYYRTSGVSGLIRLCRELRQRRFDLVMDLQGLARSGLMTFFAKAPRKVGRSDAREGATLFYKELVPLPRGTDPVHPVDILLEFCRVFGFETRLKGQVHLSLPSSGTPETASDHRLVTLFPEGRRPDMEWSGFESLAGDILKRDPEVQVQVLSSRRVGWVSRWQSQYGDRLRLTVASDPLKVAGYLQHSDLLIANDSDAIHIAAALGKSAIGLYGPTDGNKIGPYPLSEPRNCALNAPQGELERITVERVWEEAQRRL